MLDTVLYLKDGISVSRTMVKVNGSSYSIANIGSVFINRHGVFWYWFWVIVWVLASIGTVMRVFDHEAPLDFGSVCFMAFSAVMAVWAGYCARNPRYSLVFRTASSDQRALTDRNYAKLAEIQGAIEKAFAARG